MSGQTASHTFIDFALYICHAKQPEPFETLVKEWNAAVNPSGGIDDRAKRVQVFAKNNGFTFETQECIDAIDFWDTYHAHTGIVPMTY